MSACNCIQQTNDCLARHNTRILLPMVGPQTPFVETAKVDEKKRGKPARMFATYCPFCGSKYQVDPPKQKAPDRKTAINDGWFPRETKPRRPGVYRTSRKDIVHLGFTLGRWDGKKWSAVGNWGDYSEATDMVWQGTGSKRRDPFEA